MHAHPEPGLAPGLVRPAPAGREEAFATTVPEPFFQRFAWIILLMVIACFGAKAVFDTADLPPITPLHHLHAVSMLAWFVLFAVQPTLIQRGQRKTHRLLGRLSPLVVVIFSTLAVQISVLNWQRMGFAMIPTANGVNLLLFGSLYLAALACVRRPSAHKRLMLYATLVMMGPAFGRLPEIFDLPPTWTVLPLLAYQIAPAVHDWRRHGRVHPATWVGLGLVLLAVPVILGLSESAAWAAVLESLLGPAGPTR